MNTYTQLWMSRYSKTYPFLSDLLNVSASAGEFKNAIGTTGEQFSHLSATDALVQGNEESKVESASFLHIIGHSSSEGPEFITRNDNDGVARHGELKWGTGALRWVVVDGCSTLDPHLPVSEHSTNIFNRWGKVFHGIRGLYGFASISNSERTRGKLLATYLAASEPIWLAWLKACQESDTAECAMLVANVSGASEFAGGEVATDTLGGGAEALAATTQVMPDDTWPGGGPYDSYDAEGGLVYVVMSA